MITIDNVKARSVLKILIPVVLIPAAVAAGALISNGKWYVYATFAVAVLSTVLFICGFEKKKTGSRRLVAVCVMVALSVVGRFIPLLKPVAALTAITGMYLGGEAGFLCGALSALISNFYFGHGPWTPFQMLAWGLIGLMAGFMGKTLMKSRAALYVFGAISGVFFSLIMDVWTVLWTGAFDASLYLSAIAAAVPHTAIYAASNVLFLILTAKPLGEKLNRLKIRYGV